MILFEILLVFFLQSTGDLPDQIELDIRVASATPEVQAIVEERATYPQYVSCEVVEPDAAELITVIPSLAEDEQRLNTTPVTVRLPDSAPVTFYEVKATAAESLGQSYANYYGESTSRPAAAMSLNFLPGSGVSGWFFLGDSRFDIEKVHSLTTHILCRWDMTFSRQID